MAKWQVVSWRDADTGIVLTVERPVKGTPVWRAFRDGHHACTACPSPGQALQTLVVAGLATEAEADELGATPLPGVNPGDASVFTTPCANLELTDCSFLLTEEILHLTFRAQVESCVTHNAERYMQKYLSITSAEEVSAFFFTASHRCPTAELLLLAGRCTTSTAEQRQLLLKNGLSHSLVDVRDAAIQAAELWSDIQLQEMLLQHTDFYSYLTDYARKVADTLAK